MEAVILMNRRTEHQQVCSTYHSRTKAYTQSKAVLRAANVTPLNTNRNSPFQQTNKKPTATNLCFAQETMPTHHPKQMTANGIK